MQSIRAAFNYGDYTKIAKVTGLSRSYVVKVLYGERFNKSIMSAARTLANINRSMNEAINNVMTNNLKAKKALLQSKQAHREAVAA